MGRRAVRRAVSVFGVALAGCSAAPSSNSSSDGAVTFQVDLEAAQRWTASGDPVDRGRLCPRGTRQVLDAVDAGTGERLLVREEVQVISDAIGQRFRPPVEWTVENVCTDGSGSFVSVENWDSGTWTVESGTGAYRDLRGDGHVAFTTADYTQIAPRRLVVEAQLVATSPR